MKAGRPSTLRSRTVGTPPNPRWLRKSANFRLSAEPRSGYLLVFCTAPVPRGATAAGPGAQDMGRKGRERLRDGRTPRSTGRTLLRGSGPETSTRRLREQSQLDFELEFLGRILERDPFFADALRVHANNLAAKGLYGRRLQIDRRLVRLLPDRAIPWYNLACSYAVLGMTEPGRRRTPARPGTRLPPPRPPPPRPRPEIPPPRPAFHPTASQVLTHD